MLLASVVFLASFGVCSATYYQWDGGAGTTEWMTAANWASDTIPGTADKAGFKTATGAVVNTTVQTFMDMTLGGASGGILTLQPGAALTCTNTWSMGQSANEAGVLSMTGGTVTVGNWLYVGNAGAGTINISGGSITITGAFNISNGAAPASIGTVNLNGGTITANGTFGMGVGGGTGRLNITAGKLIVNGNVTGTIQTYVNNGWIKGYGSTSNIRWDTTTNPGKTTVWAVASFKATNPTPANGATNIAKNAALSWTGAAGAASHDVYFGTTSPGTLQGNKTAATFNPGALTLNTTYYWRIDEVTGPNTVTGDVWSFTTVSGQAKNPDPTNGAANIALDKVLYWTPGPGAASHDVYFGTSLNDVNSTTRMLGDINGNGLEDWGDLSVLCSYWLADPTGTEPFAAVNDDSVVDFFDYAVFSQDWMNRSGLAFIGNQDASSFNPGNLALNTTYYWRVDEVNGPDTYKGNTWSFTTGGKAYNPSPANNAAGMPTNVMLSWTAGYSATSHDVYFGTTNQPAFQTNTDTAAFDPGPLANSRTYYWQVDEVGESGTITGDLWSFTTTNILTANLKKGPYLIYPGINSQMTVLWQIDATLGCTISWGTTTSYSTGTATTTEYGTDHQHKYTITGLTPGTKYYYRVTVGSTNYTGSFNTAPSATASSVKFFMYGDTRSNPSSNNTICSSMISTYTSDPNYQTMVLHAGDWVDPDTEAGWTGQWYTIGTNTNLWTAAANMPFMGCIGNHETTGDGITTFQKYHPYNFQDPSRCYYSFDYGPVHVLVADQYTTYTSGSAQYNWIVNDLSASTKPFKILVFHQPAWCAGGSHGNDATAQAVFQPLAVQYGAQICLSGHNHYYSRAVNNGIQHLTSGSGGAPYYSITAGQPYVVTSTVNTLEYVKIEVNGNTLTGTVLSAGGVQPAGSTIDTFTVGTSSATDPTPENTAQQISTTPTLSWTAGSGATSHNVYFGTANPPAFIGGQTGITYAPSTLANATTYYWRIDEVSASGTTTGEVWSFTTVPLNTTPVYPYLTWRSSPTNSVMVNWWNPNAQGDSTVDYGTTTAYGSTVTMPTVSNFHHVELTGLVSGTTYHYRVRSSDGTMGTDTTYTVPAASPTSFAFAVYGDPRGADTANEPYYTRHQALCDWILSHNYDFALETGDTVWEGGGSRAAGFYTDFFRLESNLSKSKVIMATMGNHEVQPNGLPYYHYFDLYRDAFPANGPAIDGQGRVYSFDYGNAHFVSLSSYQLNLGQEGTWLSSDLATAAANPNIKWIFVFMHAPLYTTNTSRPNRTDEISAWGPIFDQYHVDIVFAGHNHLLERSKSIKAGVAVADGVGTVYVTDGLGGAGFDPSGSGSPGLFVTTYNTSTLATCVTINGNQLSVQSIANGTGTIIDSFTLSK